MSSSLDPDVFEFHIVSLDNKQWLFEASSAEERDDWVGAIEQQILTSLQGNEINKTGGANLGPQRIDMIKSQIGGNAVCVDCNQPSKKLKQATSTVIDTYFCRP